MTSTNLDAITAPAVLAAVLCGAAALLALSVAPVVAVVAAAAAAPLAGGLACVALARAGGASFLRLWALFLMPFHFFWMVACVCSLSVWAGALGGLVFFVAPRWLLGGRGASAAGPPPLWEAGLEACNRAVRPAFEYFSMRVRAEEPLDAGRPYLFAVFPHGVYSYGLQALVFRRASGWDARVGGLPCLVGVASSLLSLPLLRDLMPRLGYVEAGRDSLDAACRSRPARSVALVPGGIAEMMRAHVNGGDTVHVSDRLGFVRLAMRHGRPLVPVYSFGEGRTFRCYGWAARARGWLARRMRVALPVMRGRWLSPLMPFRVPVTVVVGRPVPVPRLPDGAREPEEDAVAEVHARFVAELCRLFDEHKATVPGYGPDSRLVVE